LILLTINVNFRSLQDVLSTPEPMKKIYVIVGLVLFSVIGINYYYFKKIAGEQIDFKKKLILEQSRLIGSYIEKKISGYENDLTKVIFKNSNYFPEIFYNNRVLNSIVNDLKSFYSKNRDLVSNVAVYDKNNRYLGIYIKDNDEFVLDTFPRQNINKLYEREIIIKRKGYYQSYFPFFKNNELHGNIEVEININKFLKNNLDIIKIDKLQWQWLADVNSKVLFSSHSDSITINEIKEISKAIFEEKEEFVLEHSFSTAYGESKNIISAVYPLNVLNNDLGIVFSLETSEIIKIFNKRTINLFLLSFLILLGLIGFMIFSLYRFKKETIKKEEEIKSLKQSIDQFPVGIMIQDALDRIKYINSTAQQMLFVNEDEDMIGKTLSTQFMISNKYLLKEGFNAPFDSNHFIHYEKEGNEIVISRLDIKTSIAGESLLISALIDVSALEKSRKQEAAANMAKSDFLAKMSHEIRTPMNAIVTMSDKLLKEKLSASQVEEVQIIKHSSELLLNILNTLLDFSKIEAAKMMLEEIPFKLSDELDLSLELIRLSSEKKGLEIVSRINEDVPDNLIGDPFRLRQVISNLLGNAVKFTQKGKIIIEVSLIESHNSTRTLLFTVTDTGIGITKENIKNIFGSFEQSQTSISRKYGGTGLGTTIAKQLVELMNGEIWVDSPSGISDDPDFPGTKFSFSVEVHSNEKIKKKYNFSSITQYQQIAVLILNKVKDEYDTVHEFLDRLGINFHYRVYDDATIEDTIFYIEQKKEIYHMIFIMDKLQQSGFPVALELKESKLAENFPVIMVSSNNKPGNYLKCKKLLVDYYLIQPYELNELYAIIKDIFPGIKDSGVFENINKFKSGLKILYVEDNIINQRLIQSIFKHLGYEIDIATNGLEAIEMITSGNYNIVFMDILMPEMDGITATREIRNKIKSDLPIVGISGSEDLSKKKDALDAGMNDYILKPVKIEIIKQLLIKWLSEIS